jgi:hypothetical protein
MICKPLGGSPLKSTFVSQLKLSLALTVAAFFSGTAVAQKKEPFSTLTSGNFERQLEWLDSTPVDPNSPLAAEAATAYAKLPFDVGERLRFVVTYLGVKAGIAEAIIKPPIKWNNTWAHRVTGEVKNADWFAWMIQLHDSVECVFSGTPEMYPLRFYINQQEPVSFRQSKILNFDVEKGEINQITQRKDHPAKLQTFPIAKDTKDAMALLYYFRENIKDGVGRETVKFPVFTSEKTWTAEATLIKQEKISVSGNSYDTDVYRLLSHFGHLMEQKGDIKVWFTRDARRLPVFIEAQVKFGYIKVALTEWDQGSADPSKKKIFEKIRPN